MIYSGENIPNQGLIGLSQSWMEDLRSTDQEWRVASASQTLGTDRCSIGRIAKSGTSKRLLGLASIAALSVFLFCCASASAQSTPSSTDGEFWPATDTHVQLHENYRLLGLVGLRKGEEFGYQQLDTGLGLAYQWKPIAKDHQKNIDPDKEHTFLFGSGYEFLKTFQTGKEKLENRWVLEATVSFRPLSHLLVRDQNRGEFRWVNGVFSTRYRNNLSAEYDITVKRIRFVPFASAEVFYSGAKDSWDEEQYTAGLQWPYKRLLMLETYYLRQQCSTCNPAHLNVAGLTLNLYLGNQK
jgi:hypothetical protein